MNNLVTFHNFFCDSESLKASTASGWRGELGVQLLRGANCSQGELDSDNGCLGHMREEFGQAGAVETQRGEWLQGNVHAKLLQLCRSSVTSPLYCPAFGSMH